MIFVYFYSLLCAIISKFPDIFVYDNYVAYTVKGHFGKK